ncbi:MAG: hypothetical protein ACR2NO_02000 [Chloroflexota bacterium]
MPTLAATLDSTEALDVPRTEYARRRPFMARGAMRRVRRIPHGGEALVRGGDVVESGAPVARVFRTGRATAIDLARALGLSAERDGEVARHVTRVVGDEVVEGDMLAERRALGGFQRRSVRAPLTGRLVHVSDQTGVAYIAPLPVEGVVRAHLAGRVTEVTDTAVTIEGSAFSALGRAGAGPAVSGPLMIADGPDQLPSEIGGAVVACGFAIDEETVRRLVEGGVVAVVATSVEEDALERLGWADAFWPRAGPMGAAPPATLLAPAFAPAPPTGLWEALRSLAGRPSSVLGCEESANGGVPELLVALGENAPSLYALPQSGEALVNLAPGSRVRVIAGRANGLVGEVVALSPGPYRLRSEIGAEVADVAFPYGVRLRVPVLHLQAMP